MASRSDPTKLSDIILNQESSHPGATALDWGLVFGIIIGVALLGLALILQSGWLAIAGGVVAVACSVSAIVTGIMNRTEDY